MSTPPRPDSATGPITRIVDRGYRRYDGPRLGVSGASRSLARHTAQRVLGLKRPARAKVLPAAAAFIAYVPAIVFIGISALVPDDRLRDATLPSYGQYYGFIVSALVIFAAFVAPEALCPDRRTGLLGLYLAAPLTRTRYLVTKALTVAGLLAIACVGPPLLMLVANVLQGIGPESPGDVLVLLVRVVAAGAVVTAVYSGVSLGVSALTDRRAVASAGVLMLLVLTGVVTGVLVESAGAPDWLLAFNLGGSPFQLVLRIYGEPSGDGRELSVWLLAVVNAWWVLAGVAVLAWRYLRLEVTR